MRLKGVFILVFAGWVLLFGVGLPEEGSALEKKIAVMWEGKSGMVNRVHLGFMRRMREMGETTPKVQIESRMDIQGMQEAERIFRELEQTKDGIVFLRSSGAQFLGKAKSRLPGFVGSCNNPTELGVIKNLSAPEGNITGVTYFIPYEKRFQVIRELFPQASRIGLLLQRGHPATPIDQEGTRTQCVRLGIAYLEVVAANATELLEGVEKLLDTVDLLIISSTALVIDNTVDLSAISNNQKIPLFSYAAGRTQFGAVAELAANDEKLGGMLADSVVDVVVKKIPVSQVPVKMDPEPQLIINDKMAKSIGLRIPDAVVMKAQLIK